jgi:hypothetical protein
MADCSRSMAARRFCSCRDTNAGGRYKNKSPPLLTQTLLKTVRSARQTTFCPVPFLDRRTLDHLLEVFQHVAVSTFLGANLPKCPIRTSSGTERIHPANVMLLPSRLLCFLNHLLLLSDSRTDSNYLNSDDAIASSLHEKGL